MRNKKEIVMMLLLNVFSVSSLKKTVLTAFLGYVLAYQPVYADVQAHQVTTYQDHRTGLTMVVAEVELAGIYQIIQPDAAAAISQLAIIDRELSADEKKMLETGSLSLTPNMKRKYKFAGVLHDLNASEIAITLQDAEGQLETVQLNLKKSEPSATMDDFHKWTNQRLKLWYRLTEPNMPNVVRDIWTQKFEAVYGVKTPDFSYESSSWRGQEDADNMIGSLSVFGGQAAVRETLQTQLLRKEDGKTPSNEPDVDLANMRGVDVAAHPYADMLAALPKQQPSTLVQPTISLADYVPEDRVLVLIREPREIAALFNQDNTIAQRLAPFLGGGFVDYGLLDRYAARFGMTFEQVQMWFSGNNVEEMAIFAPDVFFLDNTELTFVVRLKPNASTPFKIAQKISAILPLTLPNGDMFYLSSRDDMLFISTHKAELEKSLALVDKKGVGSLGQSAEFEVMAYQLPLNAQSRVYVYFSDPFIRRLTGPEVKIGQMRRAIARSQMETITAMALLYRLDHGKDAADIEQLKQKNYLTEAEAPAAEYTLEQGIRVVSKTWGSLDRLKTLADNPIHKVSSQEAQAYEEYRTRYMQFWQQYFDPIAVRVDWEENGKIAVETFILPLIDNSIYNMLKESVGMQWPESKQLPKYAQSPVATLAFNLPEKERVRTMIHQNLFFSRTVANYFETLMPFLGNTFAFSVQDSAPIVQAYFPGLSELEQSNNVFGGSSQELIAIPVFGAMITRPVDIAIQITDETAARKALRNFYIPSERFSIVDIVYREADETLLLDWTIGGIVRMAFSIRIEAGWLHITNHPWSPVTIVGSHSVEPNHITAAIMLSELKLGIPQIVSLAQSTYRNMIDRTGAELLPWVMTYGAELAVKMQKYALGRGTPLPDNMTLDDASINFTKPYDHWIKEKPSDNKDAQSDFLNAIQNITVWLRFEESGLRTRVEFIVP